MACHATGGSVFPLKRPHVSGLAAEPARAELSDCRMLATEPKWNDIVSRSEGLGGDKDASS
jgi:hypothetical protein